MSLLLDALKKAEKAKDEAKRRAQSDTDPDETVLQVRTRNELPDISSPPENHAEDIPGVDQKAESFSLIPDAFPTPPAQGLAIEAPLPPVNTRPAPEDPPRRRQTPPPSDDVAAPDPLAGQRAAAKNVFETKFREPNPKLPFYIALAVLGIFALSTVVYFWYQLRPPPPLVNTGAKPPADEKKVVPVQPPANAAAPAGAIPAQQSAAIPGLPATPAVAAGPVVPVAAAPSPAPPVAPSPAVGVAPKRAATVPPDNGSPRQGAPVARAPALEKRAPKEPAKLSVNRAAPVVNPKLQAGWLAYNQGDLAVARSHYQDVVREEPANRDALLGMAALEVRANRPAEAEVYYQRLLEINPRDPHAQAGLLALRAHMTDPVQAESRVKSLLANDPEAHVLYFTLGNEYAQQRRWPEAQQAYFKAFSADPDNPDFAYNLAVSLDHVRQPKLALEYYRRAISLAQQRSSNFDQNLARNRVQELAR